MSEERPVLILGASEDRRRFTRLGRMVAALGFRVRSQAHEDFGTADELGEALREAIAEAHAVIVLTSEHSNKSEWLAGERRMIESLSARAIEISADSLDGRWIEQTLQEELAKPGRHEPPFQAPPTWTPPAVHHPVEPVAGAADEALIHELLDDPRHVDAYERGRATWTRSPKGLWRGPPSEASARAALDQLEQHASRRARDRIAALRRARGDSDALEYIDTLFERKRR